MPGIRFVDLVRNFIDTLERYSATVIRTTVTSQRPARIRVITGDGVTDCILFLWTITPGGGGAGVRPANERRIQMTNVNAARLPLVPGVRTLLGGWSQEYGVYAFWDARRHVEFSLGSPSLQVDAHTLETAGTVGIGTQLRPTREGQEVVVAVAPGSLLWYVQNGLPLHNSEQDAPAVIDLIDASPEEEREFLDSAQTEDESARRFDIIEMVRAYRDARFRPDVLQAYAYKCAVCECDLKLVEAAHIVPVTHPSSTDNVTNGLALCRLHHGAYDNSLLGVRTDYSIIINPDMTRRLRAIGLDTSLDVFRSRLPERIRVPTSIEARPSAENLRLGLQIRLWPERLIA